MFSLEPYQDIFIERISNELIEHNALVAQLATGGGKCLARDTPILMSDGRIKMSQDIVVGDVLIGPDNKIRNVKSITSGKEMMYKVIPTKGDSYVVNESHILSLRITADCGKYKKNQIVNISVKDYLKQNDYFRHIAKGYRTDCIDFKKSEEIEIEPYFLGLWLGDGFSRTSSICTGDSEIINYISDFAEKNGLNTRVENNSKNSIIINLPEKNPKGCKGSLIGNFLSKNNLILNKHIPHKYKTASEKDRLELLAGIIDTDGYLHHNNYAITLSSEKLLDDIIFVARSLGFAAYKKELHKTCTNNGKVGIYYNCLISGDTDRIPVKIERKKASKRRQKKNVLNVGITLEKLEVGDYYGFEIDGDRRFILGDFTVTHNTVCFAAICKRYIDKNPTKDVIIFVHRAELLNQTKQTLFNWYGIIAQEINAQTVSMNRNLLFGERNRVFVAMVETFDRRSKHQHFLDHMKDVGLVIVDEAHLSNFKKIFIHFPMAMRIGFTATPISATKKDPMNNYYTQIVCGPTIRELIEHNERNPKRGVVQDVTYTLKNVNRAEIIQKHIDAGKNPDKLFDFDDEIVGDTLSNKRQIQNTIDAYLKYAFGKKMLCFNANVKHSELVTKSMCEVGLNAKHLDGSAGEEYRKEIFNWLKKTPNAILCNVGIATTGFDDPSIEGTILNKLTKSITLYKQMCGRSARPYQFPDGTYKKNHLILDMGDNVIGGGHGEWSDDVDWDYIFHNPKKPKDGVAPAKECPECGCINSASARICRGNVQDFLNPLEMMECGYEFPVKVAEEDTVEKEMVLISKNIDVNETIKFFRNRNEYMSLWDIIRQVAYFAKEEMEYTFIDNDDFNEIWDSCYMKVKEWIKLKGKRNNPWYKRECKTKLLDELRNHGFVVLLDSEPVENQEV